MVGREDRLFDLLNFGDETTAQCFRVLQQTFETQRVGFARCHLTNRVIHLAIEFPDLALQRERPERFAFAPADDMPVNDFARGRDKPAVRILVAPSSQA